MKQRDSKALQKAKGNASQAASAGSTSRHHGAESGPTIGPEIAGKPISNDRAPVFRNVGLPGYWAVLFLRAVVVHPAGCDLLLAHYRSSRCGLREIWHPRHPDFDSFRGRLAHGPHARAPALRRPRYRDRRKARYRPGRAHPWPGGFRTRWTTYEVS